MKLNNPAKLFKNNENVTCRESDKEKDTGVVCEELERIKIHPHIGNDKEKTLATLMGEYQESKLDQILQENRKVSSNV